MKSDPHAIVITVESGVIQSIENIPPGVRIVVRDYDVDGAERAGLVEDENGVNCVETIWE